MTATEGSSISGVIQGKEVISNILVTGDHNLIFTGSYERIRDAYLKPWSVFERVQIDRFFGRQWLRDEVEEFLAKYESGYFVLEAKAGLGKTAFLAHFVKETSCIHHFVELAPGADGIAAGLKNLAAQLILAWKLSPQGADEVLPGGATRPEFLQNLIFEAAHQRDENKPDEKIVIAIDALDEAGVPPGQNVLGLPKILPKGVYFVVSQRPVKISLTTSSKRLVFSLEAEDQNNMDDMRGYLEDAAKREGVLASLKGSGRSPQDFVETLQMKCRGVWIYLYYVVSEIERGERLPLDLDTLPQGVWQYYAQYWQRWRDQNNWDSVLLPLLTRLAAVQEDVTLNLLSNLSGVEASTDIRRLLDETWYPFLVITGEGERTYRLYHASLREFLDGRADLTELTDQEKNFTRELATATRQAHARISDFYLNLWGGLTNQLRNIENISVDDVNDRYGLKHLAAHLEASSRISDLHQLLRLERSYEETEPIKRRGWRGLIDRLIGRQAKVVRRRFENIWYGAQESAGGISSYLTDVARAWRIARIADERTNGGEKKESLSLQVRYALITASINSLAQNISPDLLRYLVENHKWGAVQASVYARQTPDPEQRAQALIQIIPLLSPAVKDESARIALTTIQSIRNTEEQMRLLGELAPHLSEELLRQALNTTWGEWSGSKLLALEALAPSLPESIWMELLTEISTEEDFRLRVQMLAKLLPFCPEPLRSTTAHDSYVELQQLYTLYYGPQPSVMLNAALFPYLSEPLKSEALKLIFAKERPLYDLLASSASLEIPAKLISHLPSQTLEQQLHGILDEITTITHPQNRVAAIAATLAENPSVAAALVTPFFSTLRQIKDDELDYVTRRWLPQIATLGYSKEAFEFTKTIQREYTRMETLARIAPFLLETELRAAFSLLYKTENRWSRYRAGSALLIRLAQLGHADHALTKAETIEDGKWKLAAIVGLMPSLNGSKRDRVLQGALATARKTRDDYGDHDRVTSSLAAALARAGAPEKALELARTAEPQWMRSAALVRVMPELSTELKNKVQKEVLERIGDRDPYSKALLLADVIPLLSRAYAKKAISQAWTACDSIENVNLKLEALIQVGPLLSDELRDQAIQLAWTCIDIVTDDSKKTRAMVVFAPYLSDEEILIAWTRAKNIRGQFNQERLMSALAPYLPRSVVEQVLEEKTTTRQHYEKYIEIQALIPRLAQEGEVKRALALATEMNVGSARLRAMGSLAKHLSVDMVLQLAGEAISFPDKSLRARVLSLLIPFIAQPKRKEMIELAIAAAEDGYDEDLRAEIFSTLLPYVPDVAKATTLNRFLRSARKMYRERRAETYGVLLPHILALPANTRLSTWNEILQLLASQSRGDFFWDLAVFMPLVSDLGGVDGLINMNAAIQDVVRWWG